MAGGVLTGIMMGASVLSGGMSMLEQSQATAAQNRQLEMQATEVKAKAAQDQIARDRNQIRAESQMRAQAGATGVAPTSGSYNALFAENYNAFAQNTKVANLNLDTSLASIQAQEAANTSREHSAMFGDLFNMGGSLLSMSSWGSGSSASAQPLSKQMKEPMPSMNAWDVYQRSSYANPYSQLGPEY